MQPEINVHGRHTHAKRIVKQLIFGMFCIASTAFCSVVQANEPSPAKPLLLEQQIPTAVMSKAARLLGDLPATLRLPLSIVLPPRNEAQIDELLKQLYDPHSPQYGRYLTPEQFTERFGPTQRDFDKVVAWARNNGFEIRRTTPSRRVLSITGTVDTINRSIATVPTLQPKQATVSRLKDGK
ncbi:hypothetical protein DUT91_19125 [Phyllobacterium salinisoli]|uniref:Peptidase S53 activation domain-containing protein n=1 Tax=Phyllobacterium salinisoli TaxID=1899321 RepID=A0A368JYB0_9HYPH|nr:protease pro-enzyme activation domain-containing protein [Phyllobacterium salinisoli]RCS22117.1 hypothetical protein DUT91_19125 [Phyllobacterium salinisoli]